MTIFGLEILGARLDGACPQGYRMPWIAVSTNKTDATSHSGRPGTEVPL